VTTSRESCGARIEADPTLNPILLIVRCHGVCRLSYMAGLVEATKTLAWATTSRPERLVETPTLALVSASGSGISARSPSALMSRTSCGGQANGAIRVSPLRSEIAGVRWTHVYLPWKVNCSNYSSADT